MTDPSAPPRKPYDATPYAALRDADAAAASGRAAPLPRSAQDIQAEIDKLAGLRAALWTAFEAGPEAGLPSMLIDLTTAYTNALRLQLTLAASAARAPKLKPSPAPEMRTVR